MFLDEVGTLTPIAQDKLLRVLQEREVDRLGSDSPRKVDIRLVAATNADLSEDVKAGRFREDLYYRINVIPVRLPPLRERHNDIPLLILHFIKKFSAQHRCPVVGLTPAAVRALLQHVYPGNLRELENMIERGVVLADPNEPIDVTDLFMGTSFRPRALPKTAIKTPSINGWRSTTWKSSLPVRMHYPYGPLLVELIGMVKMVQ